MTDAERISLTRFKMSSHFVADRIQSTIKANELISSDDEIWVSTGFVVASRVDVSLTEIIQFQDGV